MNGSGRYKLAWNKFLTVEHVNSGFSADGIFFYASTDADDDDNDDDDNDDDDGNDGYDDDDDDNNDNDDDDDDGYDDYDDDSYDDDDDDNDDESIRQPLICYLLTRVSVHHRLPPLSMQVCSDIIYRCERFGGGGGGRWIVEFYSTEGSNPVQDGW